MTRPIVGILGGMGPAATADLYTKIIATTPATRDQEHLHIVIWADPTVPDRTDNLLHDGEDPMPWLVRGAQMLQHMGATMIAVPCNTAHAFLPRVQKEVHIPFLDIMEETAAAIAAQFPEARRVGLLATTATITVGLYQQALARHGIEAIFPDSVAQAHIMQAIWRVKAGDADATATALVADVAASLITRGAAVLVTGCTELPLIFRNGDAAAPVVDPTQMLAEAVVQRAVYPSVAVGGNGSNS